jgi:serine/threonine protein kinase
MLDRHGVVKLLDLGLVRISDEVPDAFEITGAEHIMGTLAYMSPEQASNPRSVDGRSDLYELGCTLFYLLTAKTPFAGKSYADLIVAHRNEPIPLVRNDRKDVPRRLEHIVTCLLAKSPEDRFANAQELIEALTPLARGHYVDGLLEVASDEYQRHLVAIQEGYYHWWKRASRWWNRNPN